MSRLHRFAILSAVAALAVGGCRPAAPCAQVTRPSEINYPPLPAFQAPKPTRFVLPNGMVVMVIEDHELPLVNVTARIRTGSLLEPAEKIGLAGLVGTVLRSGGTTTRKPDALDEFLEARAASIESGMSADSASASMSALKADVAGGDGGVRRRAAQPGLRSRSPEDRADRRHQAASRGRTTTRRASPSASSASRSRAPTRRSARTRRPTPRSARVTRDDLLAWHKKYFHPNR